MLARCKECGKEYNIGSDESVADFQCTCGGKLRSVKPIPSYVKKEKENTTKLISCPVCKHELSSNAVTCHNCGNPTGKNVDSMWVVIGLLVPLAGLLGVTYFAAKEMKGGMAIILFSVVGFLFYYGVMGLFLSTYW